MIQSYRLDLFSVEARAHAHGMIQPPIRQALAVGVRHVDSTDGPAIVAMGQRCSGMTLYQRFLGVAHGLSPAFVNGVLAGPPGQTSVVATLADGSTVVGLATWSPDREGRGEVGLLVEDAYQCCGVGSAMLEVLLASVMDSSPSIVTALVLADRVHLAAGMFCRLDLKPVVTFHGEVAELVAALPASTKGHRPHVGVVAEDRTDLK